MSTGKMIYWSDIKPYVFRELTLIMYGIIREPYCGFRLYIREFHWKSIFGTTSKLYSSKIRKLLEKMRQLFFNKILDFKSARDWLN